jgi:cysteine synthase A
MDMKYDSILETVGRTPIVKLSKLAPPHVTLYAKVESFNPMGSVKDRLALAVIEDAERSGALKPGQTVVEATSGNTGIGLAMVCAQKGYPLVIVMAESFSIERRRLMRFLGAKVVLTPAALKGSGMLAKAEELAATHGWFLTRQFENEANARIHTQTTAQEIIADFAGERLDYWVTGFGTGGTLKGVARALRIGRPDTKIVVAEPDNSAMLSSGVPQPAADGKIPASHPAFRPHPIQGTTPDFLSKLVLDAQADKLFDHITPVNGADAIRMAKRLATEEGIFAGISAGASVAAALRVAETAPEGSTILCMLPDTGERYLSTVLFDGVSAEMSDEESAISYSTPTARFGAPVAAPVVAAQAPDADGRAIFERAIADVGNPVVMFALEWCEFSWSVRRLFQALSIPYRSIDLDSVAYQKDDLGGRIRRALAAHTGVNTIPQVFIGGTFIGGCGEVFAEHANGALAARLSALSVSFTPRADLDAEKLLPNWLAARKSA